MKKVKKIVIALILSIGLMIPGEIAEAVSIAVFPTYTGYPDSPKEGYIFVGIEGSYLTNAEEALARINEIRLEACKEGIKTFDGNTLTESDYVPLEWSAVLEQGALQRAAEGSLNFGSHTRPNGEAWNTADCVDGFSNAENLAWNSSKNMSQGIEDWYSEKADWINQTGNQTGHYTSLIDPRFKYIGIGCFYGDAGICPNCTCAELSAGDMSGYPNEHFNEMDNSTAVTEIKPEYIKSASVVYRFGPENPQPGNEGSYRLRYTVSDGAGLKGNVVDLGEVDFSSSDDTVISIDSLGRARFLKYGTATITLTSKTTGLSAQVQVNIGGTYEISYNLNGGTYKDKIEPTTKNAGTDAVLTSIVPEREGYEFVGWSETWMPDYESDASIAGFRGYYSGGRFSEDKDVTLYAVWKKISEEKEEEEEEATDDDEEKTIRIDVGKGPFTAGKSATMKVYLDNERVTSEIGSEILKGPSAGISFNNGKMTFNKSGKYTVLVWFFGPDDYLDYSTVVSDIKVNPQKPVIKSYKKIKSGKNKGKYKITWKKAKGAVKYNVNYKSGSKWKTPSKGKGIKKTSAIVATKGKPVRVVAVGNKGSDKIASKKKSCK